MHYSAVRMPTLSQSEPQPPDRAPPVRPGPGRIPSPPLATCVVWISLPAHGDEDNGKALCERIRQFVRAHPTGTFCFMLEGSDMVNARIGYANAFKELDRELGGRMEVVCAIPAPIPRMMAYTVATMAQAPWTIFRTRTEADLHLRMRGYLGEQGGPRGDGPPHLWLQNRV
ncbi:hypothetical protein [Melittangium boletus]|uniref:STAS/SEC14 domain-containing protein n=1 Tax=Melittangium boletus DSM 14713 TaxID=1294270 RepID=A0A250IIS8_9BACT|nr:hypothetical protein [Melittangium boletus]ATB31120.1 hypothetical protein MEBOL_004582 [Melittangium boletus DSM 14713]